VVSSKRSAVAATEPISTALPPGSVRKTLYPVALGAAVQVTRTLSP